MITSVTNEIHRFLQLHAQELQDDKISLANRYLTDYEKYMQVINFVNNYTKTLEKCIDRLDISPGEHVPPFVIIGSMVEVQDALTQKQRMLIISEPGSEPPSAAENVQYETISFLSDLGKSLLFKAVGQNLKIEEDGMACIGTIERINYNLNL